MLFKSRSIGELVFDCVLMYDGGLVSTGLNVRLSTCSSSSVSFPAF